MRAEPGKETRWRDYVLVRHQCTVWIVQPALVPSSDKLQRGLLRGDS
jgi:hypothetical protein